jgi:hypothetical protein
MRSPKLSQILITASLMFGTPISAKIIETSVPSTIKSEQQVILKGNRFNSKANPLQVRLENQDISYDLEASIIRNKKSANLVVINIPKIANISNLDLVISGGDVPVNAAQVFNLGLEASETNIIEEEGGNQLPSNLVEQADLKSAIEEVLSQARKDLALNNIKLDGLIANINSFNTNLNRVSSNTSEIKESLFGANQDRNNLTENSVMKRLENLESSGGAEERIFDLSAAFISTKSVDTDGKRLGFFDRVYTGNYTAKADGFIEVPTKLEVNQGDAGSGWAHLKIGANTICYQGRMGGAPDYELINIIESGSGLCEQRSGNVVTAVNNLLPVTKGDEIELMLKNSDRNTRVTKVRLNSLLIEKVNSGINVL